MSSPLRRVAAALATSAASIPLTLFMAAPAGAQTVSPNSTTPPVITTTAGTGIAGYGGDGGAATKANVNAPTGFAEDIAGNLYFADTGNNVVRKVSNGTITTVAGTGVSGFSGDGGPARVAKLSGPMGVAVDGNGNLYIADTLNNRVRKVTSAGVITSIAGNGPCPTNMANAGNGKIGPNSKLCLPSSVAFDSGNVYIADTGDNQIRYINSSLIINAVAGTGVYGNSGDGGSALNATLASPAAVTLDSLHNLYIADTGNNRVRKVVSGIINNFAGTGAAGYGGDGMKAVLAQLTQPTGLGTDSLGNVYIADTFNNRIRVVIPKGDIQTYAGTGVAGYSGDGGPATAAMINRPAGNIAVDANNIYFGDTANNRGRGVHGGPPPNIPETPFSIALLPLSAAALLAAGYFLMRRRRSAATVAAG